MAFIREVNLTKVAIGDFETKLFSHDPLDEKEYLNWNYKVKQELAR